MLCSTPMMAMMVGFTGADRPDTIGHIDHDSYPIRCHWSKPAYASRCDAVLEYVVDAWQKQVDEIGFNAPVEDEDGIVDFYVTDYDYGGAYAYCSTWRDDDPSDGLTGCPAYVELDYRTISDAELASYVVHEFNHILQYATDFNEPTYPIWEATATAAEQWTYPGELVPTNYYVADFQKTPWLGILGNGDYLWDLDGTWSYFEYGAAIWSLHLDHHYGDGLGSGGAALWDATAQGGNANSVDVIDAYDTISGGWEEALLSLSAERALIGTDTPPVWATSYGDRQRLFIDGAYTAADLPLAHTPSTQPYTTGAVYITLAGPFDDTDQLVVTVDADGGTWGIVSVSGEDLDWVQDTRMTWKVSGDTVTFGVVNLDHDQYATTGTDRHLSESQRTIQISVSTEEIPDTGEPDDTGTPDDTGEPGDTDTDTGNSGKVRPGTDDGGKGCASVGGVGGVWLWLLPLALCWRRR